MPRAKLAAAGDREALELAQRDLVQRIQDRSDEFPGDRRPQPREQGTGRRRLE